MLKDTFGRTLRDLRISVTDRCNFRCVYCMPREIFGRDYHFLERKDILTFEEIYRAAHIFVDLGVRKIRLTGGEPLMRRDLEHLIAMLAELPDIDLTLTTNGSFPVERVSRLKEAGLKRITVSLDSLDDATFQKINDVHCPVEQVLAWIDACHDVGLTPVKINMVVRRGYNEKDILPMAERFRGTGHIVRFIEFMDVGTANGWRMEEVVPAAEIVSIIHRAFPLEPLQAHYPGEVARRYRYADGQGEIGIIASVTQPFCGGCTRLRLSAEGKLFTCLFASHGHDLRQLLRSGHSDDDIKQFIRQLWQARDDRYSELRSENTQNLPKIEMSYIGG